MEKAMFGAGCFWGVEAAFRQIPGVQSTSVGYAGGNKENPTYEDVCSGTTHHVEVVLVEFDPATVTYQHLVDSFFEIHDPTQVNKQGPDWGEQYRTVIFYFSPEQQKIATQTITALSQVGKFSRPIATKVEPAPTFWKAEDYHQQYLEKRGQASCRIH
jgi:peptide-methionine (S)-S-oxide reductase